MKPRTGLNIAHDRLKEILHYDQDTGIFTWRVRKANFLKIGDRAGGVHVRGYREINIGGTKHKEHRLAWFYMYGKWPTKQIDHIDTVKAHNWIKNLRLATNGQNKSNCGLPRNNTSGHKGVCWNKKEQRWKVQCNAGGVRYRLGTFTNVKDAIKAREDFAKLHHGEFYRAA